MLTVRIVTDLLSSTGEEEQVTDLLAFLQERFPIWPATARLYRGSVSLETDVTPTSEEDIEHLRTLQGGMVYVVVYPEDITTILVSSIIAMAVTSIAMMFFVPKIPNIDMDGRSSNNSLGNRVNKPRPNERIPDIFGQVISIPELLTVPLTYFENNLEIELCYMAIGRGSYEITDIRDGETPISDIAGSSAVFYGPNNSPVAGAPQLVVGGAIPQPLKTVVKLNEVNGQTLRAPNSASYNGDDNIRFVFPDLIEASGGVDFTDHFDAADVLNVAGTGAYELEGTYTILAVTSSQIVLANPASVNPNWNNLDPTPSAYISPQLYTSGISWVGPFIINLDGTEDLYLNFTAQQGLYRLKKDGGQQQENVNLTARVIEIDDQDNEVGVPFDFPFTLQGSATEKGSQSGTLIANLPFSARCKVWCRRTSDHNVGNKNDTVVDEVKWKDCYALSDPGTADFGDITTVYTKTYATASALSVKDRKFNCRVTRKVLERNPDNTLGPALVASRSAADIICHICVDPYLGNRPLWQVDVDQIHDTIETVRYYFGLDEAGEFNYTFDQANISFEEMVQTVAQAVFCTAFRQLGAIQLFFERETLDSSLLLNHRNKLPGTESRTVRFGNLNSHDGVEMDYVSQRDGATVTVYLPDDRSAINAKKIEIQGVAYSQIAHLHANRAFGKIKHQRTAVEVTALAEASQLVLNERVEVSDNTRSDTQDGYVVTQDGLRLTVSQPVTMEAGEDYFIFLQTPSGVESIPVTLEDQFTLVLQRPPSEPLPLGDNVSADVFFQLAKGDPIDMPEGNAFLVAEKGAFDNSTVPLKLVNYDGRYYEADHQYGVNVTPTLLTKNLFDAQYWSVDGPRSMSFNIITDGPTELKVRWRSRLKSDLAGLLWYSEDRFNHTYLRRLSNYDFTGAVLSFTIDQSGAMSDIDHGIRGLTLTVNANVDGTIQPFFVRLAFYAPGCTNSHAEVTINFDTLMSGFFNDIPVPVQDIRSMFISLVSDGYEEGNNDRLSDPEDCELTITNITCNKTMQVYGLDIPPHDIGISTGYDDMYNICPRVAVKQMVDLGYSTTINHYCGMSHFYEQKWDGSRFVTTTSADAPTYGLLNRAAEEWHEIFCEEAANAGLEVIFAISFEVFSEAAVVDWMQRDWDGNLGVTGYTPPSYLISPSSVAGMNWLKSVFVAFGDILAGAGLPVLMQVGEPWWWFNTATLKPCVYDFPAKLEFNADTGLFAPEFTTIYDNSTGTPYDEFKTWLQNKLGNTVLDIRSAVKVAHPAAKVSTLFFLPSILGDPNSIMATINYPQAQYSYPNLDFFQSEAYDYLISEEYDKAMRAFSLPTDELGYAPEDVIYLSGFVPDQALGSVIVADYNLNREGLRIWRAIFGSIKACKDSGIPQTSLWSYTQVMRDGIIYHPDQNYNSFFWKGRFQPILPKAANGEAA